MFRHICQIALFMGCVMAPFVTRAMELTNIYDALMHVPNETIQARQKASARGLENVFVRASGRDNVKENALIKAAVDHPEQYIEKFRYVRRLNDMGEPETLLEITFSKQAIETTLRKAKLPVWDENRALVVLLLNDHSPEKNLMVSEFKKASFHRGVPFVVPDSSLQSTSDESDDNLKRWIGYAKADQVLSGKLQTKEDGSLVGEWTLVTRQAQHHWTDQTKDTRELFAHAIDHVVTLQTQLQKTDESSPALTKSVKIEVLNISGLKSYADVVSYLRAIPSVKHVKVDDVNPSAVLLTLYVPGGKSAFIEALSGVNKLKLVDAPDTDFSEYLRVEWLGLGSGVGGNGTISTEYPSSG